MLVQPPRHRLQLAADLVVGGEIEYAGLDGAFLIVGLRRWRFCFWNQSLDPKASPKLPSYVSDSLNNFRRLAFMDRD